MLKYAPYLLGILLLMGSGCADKGSKSDSPADTSNAVTLKPSDFYFVGMIDYYPGLYKYNFKTKEAEKFWSVKGEKIVDLSFSDNRKTAFFLTAKEFGKRGVFPFIKRVKLYRLDVDSSKVDFIRTVGSGMQVFTEWEADNSYKVILNSLDKIVANYVDQHTFIYSRFGKELVNESKTYDITKEGYPKPPVPKVVFNSEGGDTVEAAADSSMYSVYLINSKSGSKTVLAKSSQKLKDAEWGAGGGCIIFSTLDISPRNETIYNKRPNTSKLFIYSLSSKKIIKKWEGGGVKNFFIDADYVIFDNGFGPSSILKIFNYKTMEPFDTVKIEGGCGVSNIPQIPDFSA